MKKVNTRQGESVKVRVGGGRIGYGRCMTTVFIECDGCDIWLSPRAAKTLAGNLAEVANSVIKNDVEVKQNA